jgi:hypothetical protein
MTSVFALLDAEWRTLGRRPAPAGWPVECRSLGGLPRLATVVDACRRGDDPRPLAALLVLAAAGDAVACRTAVQALVPAAAGAAARMAGYVGWGPWPTRDDLDGDAAGALVEVVAAGVPTGGWPAAVLASRVRDRLRATVRRHARHRRREGLGLGAAPSPVARLDDARCAEERAADVVVAAVRDGVLTAAGGQTVLATSVYGWSPGEFAALTGRDVRAVRTHRLRATRALAAAA